MTRFAPSTPVVAFFLACCAGCSSSEEAQPAPQPGADAALEAAPDADAAVADGDAAAVDSSPDSGAQDASSPDVAQDAPALDAPDDASQPDADTDAGYPAPTLTDIQYEALAPLPQGEQLLFNDWNATPNALISIKPDGTGALAIFNALRIWSFGVSHQADRIAFSCTDPLQEQHYGVTIGDAIQHTWMVDVADQTAELLAWGNLNDECHTFGPGDARLYVCRRYDFTAAGEYKGWRIGRIDLATSAFEYVTPELDNTFDLSPQPLPDESAMLFGRIVWEPPNSQEHSVQQMALPAGTATPVRTDGGRPTLSPDGSRYVFQKTTDNRALYSSRLDGTDEIKLSEAAGTDPVWAPDASRVAYLIWDNDGGCSHIDMVAADGSQASAPVRIRDCLQTGEFMSQLAWVVRP